MTRHTIIFSEPMAAFIDERLDGGEYATLSDYVAALVGQDMARRDTAVRELRDVLDDADRSGISERGLDEILSHARSSGRKQTDAK